MMSVVSLTGSVGHGGGGVWVVARALSRALGALGVRVETVGISDGTSASGAWGDVPLRQFDAIGPRSFGFAPRMRRAIAAQPADLLHQHGLWMYSSVACLRWASGGRRPYVLSVHGMLDRWALSHSQWKKKIAGWLFQNRHLQRAACLHALCEAEARAVRAYGLRNPVCIIPNGIDPLESGAVDPSPWGAAAAGRKVMLFLGRIHPKKGLAPLLSAWAVRRLSAEAKDWVLVIAGWDQDNYQTHLELMTQRLGVGDSVLFVGPQYDAAKAATLSGADAFILPSHSEGLPMALLEAWSRGLPVLMTPQCNMPDGFIHDAAIRIEPRADSIERGLAAMMKMTPDQRRQMGQRGQRLVTAQYTWTSAAGQMKQVYEWVLGSGPLPACIWNG
jgi:glycosyltransferase involved in cell wall biosynthesis